MADFRLGRLKFKWRGAWAASTAYVIDDIVKFGGNAYVCVTNHTSASSETSFYSSDLSKWEIHTEGIVNRGDWTNTGGIGGSAPYYKINDVVKYGNILYRCITGHTAGASFNPSNFVVYLEGLKFENTWTSGTEYQKGDIATYGGYTYIAKTIHTNTITPNLDTINWDILTTGFKSQGVYNSSTVYAPGSVVRYGGNNYVCKLTTSNLSSYVVGNISGTGSVVTITFQSAQSSAPFSTGSQITVSGVNPGSYNGTFKVLSCSTTQVTYAHTANATYVSGGTTTDTSFPTSTKFWDLITEGFNWTGQWSSTSVYQLGDVVNRNGNSYICITSDTSGPSTAPELDTNGNFWNYMSQGGDAAQVLQEIGDLLYQAAGGINRIPLPLGDQSAAALREADGQVLSVGGNPLLPRWEPNNVTAPVYYVTLEGNNAYNGRSIGRAFASLRYACDYLGSLTGPEAPSASNPITIYVKAGVYEETLPITVPPFVSLIGDNLRTSVIVPKYGLDSDMQAIVLASSVSHLRFGDIVSNAAGTKTAKVVDSDYATNIHLVDITGGKWNTSDKYINIVSHTHADAFDLITTNKTFIAHEAYHRHVANIGAVSGVQATVKTRLSQFIDALAFNVKAGQNNKVWEYASALLGGTAITGDGTQDTALLNYIATISTQVMRNETVTVSSGNTQVQIKDTGITIDGSSPYCATVASAITTLVGIVTSAISNTNMSATVKVEPYIAISSAVTRVNQESTMFYVGSHTTIKDLIFEGMSGFIPSTSDDKDMDTATIRGVYFRLDPSSPIQKSPYIQNCTAIGGAAVGIMIDGAVHAHFDNSSTPSYKSMVFDAYTQILDGGVGFYVTRGASSEIVSCFTYYAHISYTSTRGGKIRAVSGNSSYGKYGCIASGFDATETTIDGNVKGKRLKLDPLLPKNGTFTVGERIQGATSGAIGELISDQSASTFLYYFPIKGTFVQGEQVNGLDSTAYVTLANNTDAVTGQKGFLLTVTGLSSAPDQGGSVEMIDNGANNDPGSFVISNSSYSPPDGRGTLGVTRGRLGSTPASHNGTTSVTLFANQGITATLQGSILQTATSPYTMAVNAVTGMVIGGYLAINNELFQVASFPSSTSVQVTRAVEGTVAQAHGSGATIEILAQKVVGQDEVIEDFNNSVNAIRVGSANIGFDVADYIKIDNEFFKLTAVTPDATGITILQFADEKTVAAGDGQGFRIRYRYSQVRLTAHDFLDVGTGSKANTNWPFLPLTPNTPANETIESRPGRVYYVSTDQDGNFAVGKFFKVEQATGKATLDASAFDLAGLSSLRLGSIGAQLGASINEFSTDGTLSQNSDEKVPTQKAVKTYVDNLAGTVGNFTVGGNLTVKGATTTVASVTVEAKDRNITLGKVATGTFTGNITSGQTTITSVSDTTNLAPGVAITLTGGGSGVTLPAGAFVQSVSGTTVTLDQAFQGTGSATTANFSAGGPSNVTAAGGGLTLLAGVGGDKSITWSTSNSGRFDSSENWNLASGKAFYINGVEVLSATSILGVGVGTTTTGSIVTIGASQTLTNKTLSSATLTGSLTAGGATGSAGQVLKSTGSGVEWGSISVSTSSISNGNSNVNVASSNGAVTVTTNNTLCATFNTSQNLVVVGTVTAQSSIALKDNVTTITDALSKVMNLRGVEFDYKASGKHQIGVVAEEVESVVPCVVDETDGIKSVAYQNLVAVLIEAVKDLKKEIDQLRGV